MNFFSEFFIGVIPSNLNRFPGNIVPSSSAVVGVGEYMRFSTSHSKWSMTLFLLSIFHLYSRSLISLQSTLYSNTEDKYRNSSENSILIGLLFQNYNYWKHFVTVSKQINEAVNFWECCRRRHALECVSLWIKLIIHCIHVFGFIEVYSWSHRIQY